MARQEGRLFELDKIEWMLAEGLDCMEAGDRQMLLVMAETKIVEGYVPTAKEKQVIERLRALAGEEYDVRDIKRKVRAMVKSPAKADTPCLSLPPAFNHLLKRLHKSDRSATEDAE